MMIKLYNRIMCVVDPNERSITALKHAINLAELQQAEVLVVSLLELPHALLKFFEEKREHNAQSTLLNETKQRLQQWLTDSNLACQQKVDCEVVLGTSFISVIQFVLHHDIDLVVKCSEDPKWTDRLFGSDDMHLMRKCPCPVLMLKAGQNINFKSVLATVDVNDAASEGADEQVRNQLNEYVFEHSINFALAEFTELHIGSVWNAYGEDFLRYGAFSRMSDENVNEYVEQTREKCSKRLAFLQRRLKKKVGEELVNYVAPKTHLVKGLPTEKIPEMVEKHHIDLVVMGTLARTGVPGLIIGNTAETILERIDCSVLAIKPPGFISPVQANRH
ncbi:MAG: universal stress protein [Aestuariibacter sp.]